VASILGLPPTPGFIIKVDISSTLIFLGLVLPVIVFNLASGALIYMYLRLIMSKINSSASLFIAPNRQGVPLKVCILIFTFAWLII
jgi:NADH:ubiquinone oxidoreductase subunit 2 (subunit N)